jgi:putative hydrolase of the HAD superfamily
VIKAIIFDCFGVLTTDTWRAFLDSFPDGTDTSSARELNRQYDAGLITEQQFLEQVQAATGQLPKQVEDMASGDVLKNTALIRYISELKANYKIGLLSNIATNWIRDSFLTADEQAFFDDMVFSHDVGMTKPDPRIFRLACQRLGVELNEAVLVDDVESYVLSAKVIGMEGVVYGDFSQCKHDLERLLRHT